MIGVRLSVFDCVPMVTSRETGRPMEYGWLLPYEYGFGVAKDDPMSIDLAEPLELIRTLVAHGVAAINVTCGSPYYNPHMQRPAIFPPIDGYQPPEDPLVGVCRQIDVVRQCKAALEGSASVARPEPTAMGVAGSDSPNKPFAGSSGTCHPKARSGACQLAVPLVGSGYTYLQDYLPQVAQAVVRAGWVDFVGLGRMVLAYPEMPADALAGRTLSRKRICRTFSDCTTAPRNGLVSGCYPLDPYYKGLAERDELVEIKQRWQQ
jgi:2,4-dienoyl-CoA reductase-like NADH-dependent reductase (Old Yellow Enzyme family)